MRASTMKIVGLIQGGNTAFDGHTWSSTNRAGTASSRVPGFR